MSKYTTELRYICEKAAGLDESKGYNDITSIVTTAAPLVFPSFPIFDEAYRLPLEVKILKHFYTREICEETVGLWKLRLDDKLNMIMPYYNKLYESELLTFDPFRDTDLRTEHDKDGTTIKNGSRKDSGDKTQTSTAHDNSKDNSDRWELFSATPQGPLSQVKQHQYLTSANNIETANTASANSTSTGVTQDTAQRLTNDNITDTETYLEHIYGKRGNKTYMQLLEELRKTFLNIDRRVINELEDLFFLLW